MLRHFTASVIFFGAIMAAGLPEEDGRMIGLRFDQRVQLIDHPDSLGHNLSFAIVPRDPTHCEVAVLIIDPRVPPIGAGECRPRWSW